MDGENALASFITSTLPTLREIQPLLEVLEEFGVHDLEDLDYIQESDLLHVLKPVEVRKLLSRFKTTIRNGENALASFITCTLPTLREIQPLLEVLEELGVHDLEDLDYIQESDLLHVLKPVEVRKLLSRFKTTIRNGENALASFITSTLPTLREIQPLLEVLEEFGVHDLEDLDYIQESDLLHVLKPVEARKLLSRFKTTSQRDVSDVTSRNQRSSNTSPETQPYETLTYGGYSTASSNSPMSTSSSSAGFTPRRASDNNWHFSFEIPWDKMPSAFIRKLEKGNRPTKSERLEIVRLVVSEILTTCSTPGKKHLSEIARKMAKAYPVAFSDVIEGEVVGSGYDSLTKQLVSRVDNLRRGNTLLSLKRQAVSTSDGEDTPPRRRRLDTYGCINWQPTRLPPDETSDSQKRTQEELKKMHKEGRGDAKCIETMMRATFFTQRKDIISGIETTDLVNEWPYFFETTGMKTHFKELTGMDIDDGAIANKYARVVSYFKSSDKTGKMETIFREMETSGKDAVDVNAAGFLLLLLKYFNEEEDQMIQKTDQKTLPSQVDCAELPSTPCIILCGASPFVAEHFMLSVDQTIVNGHITVFSDAVVLMFASYYCLNISYPAAHGATLEFLQRCIFKINPDKGSKVERKTSRKQLAVSPKVLSLISKIADYEWRE